MQERKASSNLNIVLYILLGAGLFLRLFHFFDNRSLWLDELYLSINLIKRNFIELAYPSLEYQQKAPIGFLWLVKASVIFLGKKEMALRFIPLISGILSLFAFIPVARFWLKPAGTMVAVSILALAPPLIYHSVEIKQYSTELFATILCLYLYVIYHKREDYKSLVLWGIFGSILLWFSFSSVFILAGMAIGILFHALISREWKCFFSYMVVSLMWLISFAINFYFFTSKHADQAWLIYWFKHYHAFMPFPPKSVEDIAWFFKSFYTILDYPLGLLWNFNTAENTSIRILLKMAFIPIIFGVTGLSVLFKKDTRGFLLLLLPVLLTLFASGLEKYPFFERLLVFMAPLLILFIAAGCEKVTYYFPSFGNWRYIFCFLLLTGPLVSSVMELSNRSLFGRYKKSYQKEALLYINDRYKKGDLVYVYWNMHYAYRYYKNAYQLKFNAIEGKDKKFVSKTASAYVNNLMSDTKLLERNKRVWIIYSKELWNDIGEVEGKPEFYQRSQPGELFYNGIFKKRQVLDVFQTREVNVHLLNLKK